jgi:hypothetical protein
MHDIDKSVHWVEFCFADAAGGFLERRLPVRYERTLVLFREFCLRFPLGEAFPPSDDAWTQIAAFFKSSFDALETAATNVFGPSCNDDAWVKAHEDEIKDFIELFVLSWQFSAEARHGFSFWSIKLSNDIATCRNDFPRLWDLLRFVLGRRLREQVFEPAYNDLLADHLAARAAPYQTPWAQRWIKVCFGLRTARLIVECGAVGIRSAASTLLVPAGVCYWVREAWAWLFGHPR